MARSRRSCAFFFALLLAFSAVACITAQDETDVENEVINGVGEAEAGLVGGEDQEFWQEDLKPAPGVKTVFHFTGHSDKSIPAGEPAEIIVGVSNNGDLPLDVRSVSASLYLPYDYRYVVQNFSAVGFGKATVPPSIQASFPYTFTVSKYLQPGSFALAASIIYEVDGQSYGSVFYNGTIEVVEASGFVSGETLFLVTLGLGLVGLLGMWMYGQVQKLSKTRRTKKVETGTRSTETLNNEWLQGTSFTQKTSRSISQPTKTKRKK